MTISTKRAMLWRWLRRALLSLALLLSLLTLSLWLYPRLRPVTGAPVPAYDGALIFTDVRVYNPGEAPLPHQDVRVKDGRIEAVTATGAPPPAGYRVVDGRGRTLMPGLVDLHVHVFDESDLALLLAHGVTTARNMMGLPLHLRLRAAQAEGRISGPRLFTAGPVLNGPGHPGPLHRMVATPDAARAAVRSAKADGYDFIKVYDGVSAPVFEAIVTEARVQGLDVAGHVPGAVPFASVLANYASIEHVEELDQSVLDGDEARLPGLVAALRGHPVPVVASLQIFGQLTGICGRGLPAIETLASPRLNPVLAFMGQGGLRYWAQQDSDSCTELKERGARFARIARALDQAGVPVVVGTDSGPLLSVPGESLWRELRLLRAAGLDPEHVLIGATTGAARVLGRDRELGRLAPGYRADALLLDHDPSSDPGSLEHPQGILAGGRWYDDGARKALLARGERHADVLLTVGRLLEGLY